MVGPIAGATDITMEMLPIVLPREAGGTTVMTVVISSGIMIAVPEAWTTRATSSTGNPGARNAMSVPSENRPIAATNTRARETLRQLSGGERNLQLCDLEALEQVRRARPAMAPDLLAPYAMAAEKVSGGSVEVKGGAFRSKRKWYNIQFKCELDAGSGKVASFAFLVGSAIPENEWHEHNLVADDGPADQ